MEHWKRSLHKRFAAGNIATYTPKRFEQMIQEQQPDTVIVTTPDHTHDEYIDRAVRAGCDVISEKPLTTSAAKCQRILKAVEETGKQVRVAFNYRWIPINTKVKDLLASGLIGKVRHVSMVYALDTHHGADYFRRWHSQKEMSGGLQVHKSTHHLDLINWWTDTIPEEIYAQGKLAFYGKDNAIARGDERFTRYDRYTGTDSKADPYRLDLSENEGSRSLYMNAEAETGYIRDRNVFRDGIDIEDSYDILIRTRCGLQINYSLQAFAPYEGVRTWFIGDKGALELFDLGGSHIILGQSDEELASEQASGDWIKPLHFHPLFGKPEALDIPTAQGSHGGGDRALFRDIFDPTAEPDPFGRGAGHEQGTASIMVGIAANESMVHNKPIRISDLCPFAQGKRRLSELD
jgi:predicted dehydrogenase